MHAFLCACCGRSIAEPSHGRLLLMQRSEPAQNLTVYAVHRWCERRWKRANREAWGAVDLASVQALGMQEVS